MHPYRCTDYYVCVSVCVCVCARKEDVWTHAFVLYFKRSVEI